MSGVWKLLNKKSVEFGSIGTQKSGFCFSRPWVTLTSLAADLYHLCPEDGITIVLKFMLSKADHEVNDVEALIWIAIAYCEVLHRFKGAPEQGCPDLIFGEFAPIDLWVPKHNEQGAICTTRFRVMDSIIQHGISKKNIDQRIRHFRGEKEWRQSSDTGVRNLRVADVKTALFAENIHRDYAEFMDFTFRFIAVFEWYQIYLLTNGFAAEAIVTEFGKIRSIREEFYREFSVFGDNWLRKHAYGKKY